MDRLWNGALSKRQKREATSHDRHSGQTRLQTESLPGHLALGTVTFLSPGASLRGDDCFWSYTGDGYSAVTVPPATQLFTVKSYTGYLSFPQHIHTRCNFKDCSLTRPLRCLFLFHPIVVSRVVAVIGEADPRPRDANAGVPVVVIADPAARQVGGPPGFGQLAHSAGGHGAVTLGGHVRGISEKAEDQRASSF